MQINAVLLATVMAMSMVGMTAGLSGPAAADQHQPEDSPDLTEYVNFTVVLPHDTDHYPGSQNEYNASIEYFAAGDQAFEEMGVEENGLFFDYIEVTADWIDYSECSSDNTYAFGIDRGNNNTGVQHDEDLLEYQRANNFYPGGIQIWFFDWEDFGDARPPHMRAEDAVVAGQGKGSAGGACLQMTDEPGWYRVQAFANGTEADNGPDEPPSDSAETLGFHLKSTWIYICECDSREEAEEQLGPPPEDGEPEPTPTPEPSGDETDPTPTPTPEPSGDETDPTATQTPEPSGDETDPTPTPEPSGDDGSGAVEGQQEQEQEQEELPETPTPGEGPGFGPVAALLALLASALLVRRRR